MYTIDLAMLLMSNAPTGRFAILEPYLVLQLTTIILRAAFLLGCASVSLRVGQFQLLQSSSSIFLPIDSVPPFYAPLGQGIAAITDMYGMFFLTFPYI